MSKRKQPSLNDLVLRTEDDDQIALVNYIDTYFSRHVKYTSIPNSTYTKSWPAKRKNTAMGLRAGFPDLVFIIKNKFFCIEMKREKRSKVSDTQKEWIQALKDASIPVYVCYGFNEAKDVIDSYVKQV